jgi:hypothetical protein
MGIVSPAWFFPKMYVARMENPSLTVCRRVPVTVVSATTRGRYRRAG